MANSPSNGDTSPNKAKNHSAASIEEALNAANRAGAVLELALDSYSCQEDVIQKSVHLSLFSVQREINLIENLLIDIIIESDQALNLDEKRGQHGC
jgi:hypothetical protein